MNSIALVVMVVALSIVWGGIDIIHHSSNPKS